MFMNRLHSSLVDVLLSTYNGSKYLPDLVISLINQTYQNWRLLIRDDGSTDGTIDLIERFSEQYPNKIVHVVDNLHNLGPGQSFSQLMAYSNADLVMFCDQDDYWLSSKIEVTLEEMLVLEEEFPHTPLLVHTDLTVADTNLEVIAKSFWSYQNINPKKKHFRDLLIQNIATGCTVMINKKLKELAYPVPTQAIMHDWWVALVASTYAGIHHIDESTILYRQHGENNTGASKYSLRNFLHRFGRRNESIDGIFGQANQLLVTCGSQLNARQLMQLKVFVSLVKKTRFIRLLDVLIYRFRKHGVLRNLGFVILMFCVKRTK